MYEKHHEPLASKHVFFWRMVRSCGVAALAIVIALYIGMWGYHYYEHMSWTDAYANASMILSGMGPLGNLSTEGGKIFAGSYALFSGLLFILIISLIMAPILHRFFHKFHMEDESSTKRQLH